MKGSVFLKTGDLFKETYFVQKKLRVIDSCISVYHVTYLTKDGDKTAMLFYLDDYSDASIHAFENLISMFDDQGLTSKILAQSMKREDTYVVVAASLRNGMPVLSAPKKPQQTEPATTVKPAPKKKSNIPRIMLYVLSTMFAIFLFALAIHFLMNSYDSTTNDSPTEETHASQYVAMPSLLGKNINESIDLLSSLRLYYRISSYEDSEQYEKDQVMKQSIEPNQRVATYTVIELVVSNGKIQETTQSPDKEETTTSSHSESFTDHSYKDTETGDCKVPDLTNLWESNVEDELTSAGLVLGTIHYEHNDETEHGRVFNQNVKPGDMVKQGTVVDIWVSIN